MRTDGHRGGAPPPRSNSDSRDPAATVVAGEDCEAIFATTTDGAWLFDDSGRIRYVNDSYCRMSGYERRELVGQPIEYVEAVETAVEIAERIRRVATRGSDRFETEHRAKDGHRFAVAISVSYWQERELFVLFARDIAERRRLEQQLHASEELFRTGVDALLDSFSIVSPVRDETGRIVDFRWDFVNAEACRRSGLARDQIVGRSASEVLPGYPESEIFERHRRVAETGRPETFQDLEVAMPWGGGAEISHAYDGALVPLGDRVIITSRDVTGHVRSEADQRRLAAVVDSLADAVMSLDLNRRFTSWNPGAERLYGYTAREVLGQPVSVLAPESLREQQRELNDRVMRGETVRFETQRCGKDGVVHEVLVTTSPICDRSGAVIATSAIHRDITEQKRMQEDLLRSEELFRGGFEHSPIGMVLTSREGRLLRVNAAFASMLGYDDPHDLVGVDFRTITHQDDVAGNSEGLSMMFEKGTAFRTEKRYVRRDGTVAYVILGSTIVNDSDGEPIAVFTQVEDVTDRVLAEAEIRALNAGLEERIELRTRELAHANAALEPAIEALQESERRHRAVVSTLAEGVIVVRADGTIEDCNPAAERILGLKGEQMMGRTTMDPRWMTIRDDGTPFPGGGLPVVVTLSTGQAQRGVIMGVHKPNGSVTWLSVDTELIRRHDDPGGGAVLASFSDITARRTAERRLQARTAELERLNHELEAFAYSISHDLRAPLQTIDGFSHLLLKECGERLDGQAQHRLERIRTAAVRMGKLIEGMLALSQSTRRPFTRQTVDLSDTARQIAAELQHAGPQPCAEIEIEDGLIAQADPALVGTVLTNLFSNAIKFTSKVGQPRIRFGARDHDGVPVYFVSDNGVGFAMDEAKQLFLPFHRLHTDGAFPGEGIGLATASRAIHRHDGAIWIRAVVDGGATVEFSLTPGARPPADAVEGVDVIPGYATSR